MELLYIGKKCAVLKAMRSVYFMENMLWFLNPFVRIPNTLCLMQKTLQD